MKHIKYIIAALSFLAFLPVATAQKTREGNPIHVNKTVTGNYTDGYTLTMESYVQGNAHTEVEHIGADVILAMDMSSSMNTATSWNDWEDKLPLNYYSENTRSFTYGYTTGYYEYSYLYQDHYYYVSRSAETYTDPDTNATRTVYTLWITIDGQRKYLRGTGLSNSYDPNITSTTQPIFTGTLYQGLTYGKLTTSLTNQRPAAEFRYWYKYGDGVNDYAELKKSTRKVDGITYYLIYCNINGTNYYFKDTSLVTEAPLVATETGISVYFKPDVIFYDTRYAKTDRCDGLQAAVYSFIDALRAKALADQNNPLDHRIALISFNTNYWGRRNSASTITANWDKPVLKEFPQHYQSATHANGFSYILKDFKTVAEQSSYEELTTAVGTLEGYTNTYYSAGLSLARGLIQREGGAATGSDFDSNGTIDPDEIPIAGFDHTNYNDRPKILIYIGDAEMLTADLNSAIDLANDFKSIPNTTIFFVYVNSNNQYKTNANKLASSNDKVIPVAEYDDTLIDALIDLTDHIGGSEIDLGSTTVVQDVVTSDFKVPAGASSVVVKTAPYTDVTGAYADNSFGDAVESSLEPTITTDTATGETTITVTGFDFGANWCGLDDGTPRGNKLILEVKIEPDGDLIGGKLATNTPESGLIYTLDGEDQFLPFPTPTINDIPLHITIVKNGLRGEDNAVFTVKAVDADGNAVASQKPMKMIVTSTANMIELKHLDDNYYYEITEEKGWAWDYNLTTPQTLSTKTQHKNPFVFTSEKQNADVKHDENLIYIPTE